MRRLVLLALLAFPGLASAQAQNIAIQLQAALERVNTVAAETFGRSLPLPSASAGVSYAFDPATGNFQRQPSTFGQVYLDRADPIGARKLNVQFAYQYVTLTEIDGQDADELRDPDPIYFPGRAAALELPRLGVDVALHQFLFAGTYGITEDLEVSLAIPVVYSDIQVRARLAAAGISAIDGSLIQLGVDVDDTMRTVGVGDILLRGKYRVFDDDPIHVSAGLLLRMPSGDVEDLSGVGFFEVAPALLASTRVFQPRPGPGSRAISMPASASTPRTSAPARRAGGSGSTGASPRASQPQSPSWAATSSPASRRPASSTSRAVPTPTW